MGIRKKAMNGKKRMGAALCSLLAAVCLTLALSGCGSQYNAGESFDSAMPEMASERMSMTEENSMDMVEAGEMGKAGGSVGTGMTESAYGSQAAADRKLIRTVDMDVETREYDNALAAIKNRVEELGGYIESMESYNGSSYYGYNNTRNANLLLRIPEEQLNSFLDEVSNVCNVVRQSENVVDVTLSYVDLESRREVLRAEQDRLLEFMGQAENMEDVIAIEQRLSEVQYELESMESQLRTYDNRISYGTVHLYVAEVEVLTPAKSETVWERISGGFMDSLKNVCNGLVDFVIWILTCIPYLLVWAAVITLLVLFIKGMIRRSRKKKAKEKTGEAK